MREQKSEHEDLHKVEYSHTTDSRNELTPDQKLEFYSKLTPAQHELLHYCDPVEAGNVADHLKNVHELAAYFSTTDLGPKEKASLYVMQELIQIISNIKPTCHE